MNKKKIAIGALGALILTGSGVSLAAANNSEHARAEVAIASSAEISPLSLTGAMNLSALAHLKAGDDADSDVATPPADSTPTAVATPPTALTTPPPTVAVDEESSLNVEVKSSDEVDNENSDEVDNQSSDSNDNQSSDSLNLDLSVGSSD